MKLIRLTGIPMFVLIALASLPQIGHAQILDRILGKQHERSAPGQTYRAGQPSPVSAQQPAPQQQPQYAQPGQAAANVRQSAVATNSALPAGTPVIMEFSDLQCPDSARYNNGLKNTIMQRYVNSNRVAYQWHDFPLPVHGQAQEAAAAARCGGPATDQIRQRIMDNQGQMSANVYAQYARQAGINSTEFSACIRDGHTVREVMNDKALGQSMGVRGTPSLVLGTSDGQGRVRPVKVVKGYDPPQQVLAEIDNFVASAGQQQAPAPQPARTN